MIVKMIKNLNDYWPIYKRIGVNKAVFFEKIKKSPNDFKFIASGNDVFIYTVKNNFTINYNFINDKFIPGHCIHSNIDEIYLLSRKFHSYITMLEDNYNDDDDDYDDVITDAENFFNSVFIIPEIDVGKGHIYFKFPFDEIYSSRSWGDYFYCANWSEIALYITNCESSDGGDEIYKLCEGENTLDFYYDNEHYSLEYIDNPDDDNSDSYYYTNHLCICEEFPNVSLFEMYKEFTYHFKNKLRHADSYISSFVCQDYD